MNRYEVSELKTGAIVMVVAPDKQEYVGIFNYPRFTDTSHDASGVALVTFGRQSKWIDVKYISHQMTQDEFKAWVESKQQKS
jgi:hypothetical protein